MGIPYLCQEPIDTRVPAAFAENNKGILDTHRLLIFACNRDPKRISPRDGIPGRDIILERQSYPGEYPRLILDLSWILAVL